MNQPDGGQCPYCSHSLDLHYDGTCLKCDSCPPPKPPAPRAADFLREITRCRPEHFIEVRCISPTSGKVTLRKHCRPADQWLATIVAEGNAKGWNCYFGVAPR